MTHLLNLYGENLSILNPYIPEFSDPQNPDPILVTLTKMQPHNSQSSRENVTPFSRTYPLVY